MTVRDTGVSGSRVCQPTWTGPVAHYPSTGRMLPRTLADRDESLVGVAGQWCGAFE